MSNETWRYKLGDIRNVTVQRTEANFDRACDEAYRSFLSVFGIDDDGRSKWIKGWERSSCHIEMTFTNYKRTGSQHLYDFVGYAVKETE